MFVRPKLKIVWLVSCKRAVVLVQAYVGIFFYGCFVYFRSYVHVCMHVCLGFLCRPNCVYFVLGHVLPVRRNKE